MAPPQLYRSNLATAARFKKRKVYSEAECVLLINDCEELLKSVDEQEEELVCHARELSTRAGLSMDTDLPVLLRHTTNHATPLITTGGHSNTDHRVPWTGDYSTDRTAQLRRALLGRYRAQCPENKGEDRWDKPRIAGERRRRIVREKDLPGAPPAPPPTGYVVFVGQRTCKWRHDHPGERHDQTRVVQEISKLWRVGLTDEERHYYNQFAIKARAEYKQQQMEFRATGVYTPSAVFERPENGGFWAYKRMEDKSPLEREIATYETVVFPARPPEFDEDYIKRDMDSKLKRKKKLQQEAEERRRVKEKQAMILGIKPPQRRKRRSKNDDSIDKTDDEAEAQTTGSEAGTDEPTDAAEN